MPRLKLDPLSPSGVSPVAEVTTVKQSNGYVTNNIRGLITAGNNVTLTGSGTESNPYQIAAGDMDTAATWGNITGTLSSQTDLTTALGNYVPNAGGTMTGALTFSGGSAPTLGKISISQVSNVSTAGIVITNSTVGAALRAWVDGANYVRIDNSSMADKGILFNGQGTGGIGIQTTATTHSVTLGSTATGIALYNTSDQTTNYERFRTYYSGGNLIMTGEYAGTGAGRNIIISAFGGASSLGVTINSNVVNGVLRARGSTGTPASMTSLVDGAYSASSGVQYAQVIQPTINQSSTAGYTALLVNPTETSTGSGNKYLADFQVGGSSKLIITNGGAVIASNQIQGSSIRPMLSGVPVNGMYLPATNTIGFATNTTSQMTIDANGNHFYANSSSVPASNPSGGGYLYIESGALKYRGSSGTVTTVANA